MDDLKFNYKDSHMKMFKQLICCIEQTIETFIFLGLTRSIDSQGLIIKYLNHPKLKESIAYMFAKCEIEEIDINKLSKTFHILVMKHLTTHESYMRSVRFDKIAVTLLIGEDSADTAIIIQDSFSYIIETYYALLLKYRIRCTPSNKKRFRSNTI